MKISISKNEWAFVFTYLSMFVLGMSDNIRGPLFSELLLNLKLSNSQGSFSFAIASTAALLGNIFSTKLFKRFSLSDVLTMALFIMATGLLIMGVAIDFYSYSAGAFLFGASMGLMGVTQTVLITESTEPEKQSRALSGLHGVYGLSSLIAPFVAYAGAAKFGIWQAAFFIASVLAMVFGLLSVFTKAQPEFDVHEINSDVKKSKNSFLTLFTFGGIFSFYVVAEIMVSSRLALYMRTYFNMDLENSSHYVTYFFAFLLLGRVLFAFKSFQYSLRKQLNTSLIFSILFLILGMQLHPFFLVLMGFSMAPFYPMSISYISEQTGVNKRQFITFALSFQSICVISMHLGVGYLTDHFGLFYAFGVGIISLVLALVCINFHPKAVLS